MEKIKKFINNYENKDWLSIQMLQIMGDKNIELYNHNTQAYYHPASLIKIFNAYLAAKIFATKIPEELLEAIKESLRVSDNDALSLVLDYNSQSLSGRSLEEKELEIFLEKRKSISDFFVGQGFSSNIQLACKCFEFAHYGSDRQALELLGPNQINIEDGTKIMLRLYKEEKKFFEFMQRDLNNTNDQEVNFIGKGIKDLEISNFYSKAGWNSHVRHDIAIFDYKEKQYLMSIFSKNLSEDKNLISKIASLIISF